MMTTILSLRVAYDVGGIHDCGVGFSMCAVAASMDRDVVRTAGDGAVAEGHMAPRLAKIAFGNLPLSRGFPPHACVSDSCPTRVRLEPGSHGPLLLGLVSL